MATKNTQLIYYLICELQNHSNFSRSILQQLIVIIDHISYLKTGKQISQFEKFVTFSWGIIPKPTDFFSSINYLEENKLIKFYQEQIGSKTYGRYAIIDKFDVNTIAQEELTLINEIIEDSRDWTSRSINNFYLSSYIVCRAINPEGWSLDFENTLLTLDDATESDINWGKKMIN